MKKQKEKELIEFILKRNERIIEKESWKRNNPSTVDFMFKDKGKMCGIKIRREAFAWRELVKKIVLEEKK